MRQQGVHPNIATYTCVLETCSGSNDLATGKQIHQEMLARGFPITSDLQRLLLKMYLKCGYQRSGEIDTVLSLVHSLLHEKLDSIDYSILLSVCADLQDLNHGKQIHKLLIKNKVPIDPILQASLVVMYGKCKRLEEAYSVFSQHKENSDAGSWNSMISLFAQDKPAIALQLYYEMQQSKDNRRALSPTKVTYLGVLAAAANLNDLDCGKQIHSHLLNNFHMLDVSLYTALLTMYAKCNKPDIALSIFTMACQQYQDTVLWNAALSALIHNGKIYEATTLYIQMKDHKIKSDNVTYTILLTIAADLVNLELGIQVHQEVITSKETITPQLENSLINMYFKCGRWKEADSIFQKSKWKKLPLEIWNTMIAGHGYNGNGKRSVDLFTQLENEGISPNDITYVCVLNACSHSGLADDAGHIFSAMESQHGITPKIEHHNCMVDMMSRLGHLKEAEQYIKNMTLPPNVQTWKILLSGCRLYEDEDRAEQILEKILELDI
jgi:pentatricopeptide repeat protein